MTILQSFGIEILISRFLDVTILFNEQAEALHDELSLELIRKIGYIKNNQL